MHDQNKTGRPDYEDVQRGRASGARRVQQRSQSQKDHDRAQQPQPQNGGSVQRRLHDPTRSTTGDDGRFEATLHRAHYMQMTCG